MTGLASTLSATSAASARACDASVVARSSSKYFPWRTSPTPPYPRECRASAIVLPCGSNTDGFSVTKTRARMRLDSRSDRPEHPVKDVIDVLQLLVEAKGAIDVARRQHGHDVAVGQQQRL